MSEGDSFIGFIGRVRAGDEEAARELCQRYEPLIRTEIRLRLRDPRLRRRFDEGDVCQSVLASFFLRATAGQFDLGAPEDLPRLLAVMARNKVAAQVRRHNAGRRDYRRAESLEPGRDAATADTSPSQVVAFGELFREFRKRLTDEERRLADLRAEGRPWAEVAALLGGTPDARRVQLERVTKRVVQELGLEDDDE
jgi:RNA polymerase sigma-70 factor (ECF subfamily)